MVTVALVEKLDSNGEASALPYMSRTLVETTTLYVVEVASVEAGVSTTERLPARMVNVVTTGLPFAVVSRTLDPVIDDGVIGLLKLTVTGVVTITLLVPLEGLAAICKGTVARISGVLATAS